MTFQWADTQSNNSDPATIESVTIYGDIYTSFASGSSYTMTRLGPDGDSRNAIVQNGTTVNNNSSNLDWDADALAAFQDKNLNHYFTSNNNGRAICTDFNAITTTDAQIQSINFGGGVPSNAGGVLAITDRNSNNYYYIAVYGIPAAGGVESFLGDTFVLPNSTQWGPLFNAPPVGVDYWNAGRVLDNGGTVGVALFLLDQIAPVGSRILRVELTASTVDLGDGKVFILQKYALPYTINTCMNLAVTGDVNGANVPSGSTFSLLNAPSPAGDVWTFDSDGNFAYAPHAGFSGTVTFDYELCLPAPNVGICDDATVTMNFSANCTNCSAISNSDGPALTN